MRKGAAHIIIFVIPRLNKLLEFGNYFIKAAISVIVNAVTVVNLFSAVQTKHNDAHFLVGKLNNVIVD